MTTVRNMRQGEQIPFTLQELGVPYLDHEWVWVVGEPVFAIFVCSFAHGLLVLWRVKRLDPLPLTVSRNWFLEAVPQIFQNAEKRGCVGILTMLEDNKKAETKIARLISRYHGKLVPFQGCLGIAPLGVH